MQSFNTSTTRTLALVTSLTSLAACSAEQGAGTFFFSEAGTQIESGANFGNATLHNQLVQTCRANGSGFGKAGAGAGDPVVVLDAASTPQRQIYRVHCDGNLDGKFAKVIYDTYVGGAREDTTVQAADAEQ